MARVRNGRPQKPPLQAAAYNTWWAFVPFNHKQEHTTMTHGQDTCVEILSTNDLTQPEEHVLAKGFNFA